MNYFWDGHFGRDILFGTDSWIGVKLFVGGDIFSLGKFYMDLP